MADKVNIESSTATETTESEVKPDTNIEQQPESEVREDNAKDATTTEEQPEEMEVEKDIAIDPAVIDKLTTGTLGLFLPNLQKAKGSLNEALHSQEVQIETIQQMNANFNDSAAMAEIKTTMEQAKFYHTKLINLRKEMTSLMDKSTKLKRRAVKLSQQKQKEELTKAAQIERAKERERMLQPKVAKKQEQSDPPS